MAEGSKEGKFWKGVTSKAQKFSVRAKQKVSCSETLQILL